MSGTEIMQKQNQEKVRRLIKRGAMAESLIDGTETLTDEQMKTLLTAALSTRRIRKMHKKFLKEREIELAKDLPY